MNWGNSALSTRIDAALRALSTGAAAFAACQAGTALAAPRDTATTSATASVDILAPASVIKARDLSFGRIANVQGGGSVVLDPATDTCARTGALQLVGQCHSAEFMGMARPNAGVRILLGNVTSLTGPGAPMAFNSIVMDIAPDLVVNGGAPGGGNAYGLARNGGTGNNKKFKVNTATGMFTFHVGGTLWVNPNQAPGVYTGTIDVTVQFQ